MTVLVTNKERKGKPTCMPHCIAIYLYPYLEKARLLFVANWLDSQTWRVGMSSNDGKGISWLWSDICTWLVLGLRKYTYGRKLTYRPLLTNCKGDNRGAITGQIIFTPCNTRLGPRLLFFYFLESCVFKELPS